MPWRREEASISSPAGDDRLTLVVKKALSAHDLPGNTRLKAEVETKKRGS